jgi:BirA family biotin operon repressor/biotin-[acetyl-CoA-carboxylase] ligase
MLIKKSKIKDIFIITYENLDSSSLEAKRIIEAGSAKNNLVIWVKNQTNGHGRYGRIWENSGNGNLTFSFILKNNRKIENISIYPFIIALAIKDSIEEYITPDYQLTFKWPNDILLNGKKIAGILLESTIKNNIIKYIIFGVGINILSSPPNLEYATYLCKGEIKNINLEKLIKKIVLNSKKYLHLADSYQDDQIIYDLWLKNAHHLGQEVTVVSGNEEIKGIFETIDNGNLIVNKNNIRKKIVTGDVFFLEKKRISCNTI